jgi:hypothetical protein
MLGMCSKEMKSFSFAVFFFSLLVLFAPLNSHASATATISGQIDPLNWTEDPASSLPAFWTSDSSQTIMWWNQGGTVQTSVSTDGTVRDSHYISPTWTWGAPYNITSTYTGPEGTGTAIGSADATLLSFSATTTANLNSVEASGRGARVSWFQVTGSGTLTFTFPYSVHYDLKRDDLSDGAFAYSYPSAQLENFGQVLYDYKNVKGVYTPSSIQEHWWLWGPGPMSANGDSYGVMTLSLHFNDKDWGYFNAVADGQCSAYSIVPTKPVPLPSGLLLLGPGFVGIAAVRRRFNK